MAPPTAPAIPRTRCASGSPRLRIPVSDRWTRYDLLAYLEADDAPTGELHAFLAYQETSLTGAGWRVRVDSLLTPGAVFEPAAMVQQAQAATARGERSFAWGFQCQPTALDARQIEFRMQVDDGWPVRLELHVRLRQPDGAPAAARRITCKWPAGPARDA